MARLPVRRTPSDEGSPVWDPWAEMNRLAREMSALVQGLGGFASGDVLTPAADVEETEDAYLVEVELPGVKKGDVTVELAGRRLTVRAERKERERVGVLRRRTRTSGHFAYEILLPGEADAGAAEASLEDGVLSLRLPKSGTERGKRITIR